MKVKKALPYGGLVIGGLIAASGLAAVLTYILKAIIARIGESNQSLLFWYLPILFMGIIGMLIGPGLGVWGVIRLKNIRQQSSISDN